MIYHLVKERGFTLEGAKIHLKEQKQEALDSFDIIRKLESIRGQLLKIKEQSIDTRKRLKKNRASRTSALL